ncbi:hypothetical protein Q9233_013302 [Columba guinea]|nr:hypothetical protein Q9233_013302 [Columba guinea]
MDININSHIYSNRSLSPLVQILLILPKPSAVQIQSAQFYKVTTEQYQKAADEVSARFKRYESHPICADLQEKILQCYRQHAQETLSCSALASQYLRCVNHAKQRAKKLADPPLPDFELAAKHSVEEKQTFLRPDDSVKSEELCWEGRTQESPGVCPMPVNDTLQTIMFHQVVGDADRELEDQSRFLFWGKLILLPTGMRSALEGMWRIQFAIGVHCTAVATDGSNELPPKNQDASIRNLAMEGPFNKYVVDELMAKNYQPPAIPYLQNYTLFVFPNMTYFVYFANALGMYGTMHYRVCIKEKPV